MELQPTINIGVIGSVSNGKSTLVKKITGITTQKYLSEQIKNITIKLGYANAKIYKCQKCPRPSCYQSFNSNVFNAKCKICDEDMLLIKHVSFIDCPGHNHLLETMLNGTCIMDCTMLIESVGNKIIPTMQTIEHVKATNILQVPNILTCINKIDLVDKNAAKLAINKLDDFLSEYSITGNIVPVSANMEWNIDVLCEYICLYAKEPEHDLEQIPKMLVIRSFNVNKPNTNFQDLVGGVIGGSIVKGKFEIGDKVCLLPGLVYDNLEYKPIISKIVSINSENNILTKAIPGGLLGIGLDIDPALTVNDRMSGQIMFLENNMDNHSVYKYLGIKLKPINEDYKSLKKGDKVSINHCGNNIEATIDKINNLSMLLNINKLICIDNNDKITISKVRNNNENNTGIIYGMAILIPKYCVLAKAI
ncbi:eukaryotic translation initiation factor 2 gamma subunit [Hokovirus HKV1]|uniref:Eukaryotic translation initiation factor 2 gamma subunit n=1 Tax=Hokovirus HKV1 TaxID=1977638 RepID=A0A1V0SGK1_9VIRU|nr:eukaryotic translation initiation factor 2 gamma subunit [Hokovirus HKV1]